MGAEKRRVRCNKCVFTSTAPAPNAVRLLDYSYAAGHWKSVGTQKTGALTALKCQEASQRRWLFVFLPRKRGESFPGWEAAGVSTVLSLLLLQLKPLNTLVMGTHTHMHAPYQSERHTGEFTIWNGMMSVICFKIPQETKMYIYGMETNEPLVNQ